MADRLIVAHGNGLRSAPMVLSCHRITIPEKDVNHHGDQWDPVPSHEILDFFFFFLFSLFLYSVYDIHYKIASLNFVYEECFERLEGDSAWKWESSRNGILFLFLSSFVFWYITGLKFFFFMQEKLTDFWLGTSDVVERIFKFNFFEN